MINSLKRTDTNLHNWRESPYSQWSFQHAPHCDPELPHIVFSISKSVIALLSSQADPLNDQRDTELLSILEQVSQAIS